MTRVDEAAGMSNSRETCDVFGGVRVTLAEIAPNHRFDSHTHPAAHLCFVLSGGFRELNRTGVDACGEHGFRLSPAGDRHSIVFGPGGARCLLVEYPKAKIEAPARRAFLSDAGVARCALALFEEFRRGERVRGLRVEELALELMAGGLRRTRARAAADPPPWLQQIRIRLDEGGSHDATTRDELAEAAGVHPTHLTRAFREHFGVTPAAYRNRRRVEQAVGMLAATDRSLAQIAVECGFSDQSHMTRCLVRRLGESPLRIRRKLQFAARTT